MTQQENQPLFEPGYRIRQLELYNWGGFSGYHSATVDPDGTAIVGPTGSGKTTLVDALMTLLGTNPKYNLASTGGHESDRDLVSYVRGVAGVGDGSGGQSHIARPGKTLTGICATLASSDGEVRLGALLWVDSNSSATSDLQKLWIFATGQEQNLQHWLTLQGEGGLRQLRQWAKDSDGIWLYPNNKRNYLARTRDFFEVRDNAFNLLNRAAGLKQLNSIDEIFRELVLDDCAQFERAKEVADSFDDLTEIYQEIELARRQIHALEPVKLHWEAHLKLADSHRQQERLCTLFPGWFAGVSLVRWQDELKNLQQQTDKARQQLDEVERQSATLEDQRERLHARFLQLGGSDIQAQEELAGKVELECQRRENNANDYRHLTRRLQLDERIEHDALLENQRHIKALQHGWQEELDSLEEQAFAAGVSERQVNDRLREVENERDEVRRNPASNIAPQFLYLRMQLAGVLELDEEALPFVAELIQVKQDEHYWRGAIERAIGSHRLRLLVPARQMQQALVWVNGRDNRLHVRLLEVQEDSGPVEFFTDGFTRKLDYKQHPYRHAVQRLLAGIDRHCVEDVSALRRTEHAMTVEGTLSGKRGYFDKQDQKRLQDDWQTGFDNKDRLHALEQQFVQLQEEQQKAGNERRHKQAACSQLQQHLRLAEELLKIKFGELDYLSSRRELDNIKQHLAQLTAPDSDLEAARLAYEESRLQLKKLDEVKTVANKALASLQEKQRQAQLRVTALTARATAGQGIQEEFAAWLQRLQASKLEELQHLEQEVAGELAAGRDELGGKLARKAVDLAKAMQNAKNKDQGALSEAGTEQEDISHYLQRLQVLVEEDLPAKRQRFKEYLNRSSEDGVLQLLSEIDDEVERIRERLDDVNNTLRRVDFQPGRYLEIKALQVQHESRRTLNSAMEALNHARYVDDEGESHYQALQHIVGLLRDAVERQRTQAAKALLDPRFRLEFKVADISRLTGEIIETRSGSQGGSGGEKEIIASYVLTASLSYALCPDGSRMPLFASIVLDEAFSRSSHAVAGRIIAALKEFGLHALFVTPNKEMRLLRSHTRSAIIVHRRDNDSSLTCLSWQELDQLAKARR